jgi:hypothetical protein
MMACSSLHHLACKLQGRPACRPDPGLWETQSDLSAFWIRHVVTGRGNEALSDLGRADNDKSAHGVAGL